MDVIIPEDLWDGDGEAAISVWFCEEGERVAAGAVLAEIAVEKSSYELLAPASGTIGLLAATEASVARGQIVARIG
jgi:pyruvate/2-oxoglutarate dehydrogenase complex dihydrolipoamide acyltransferase (E2) component